MGQTVWFWKDAAVRNKVLLMGLSIIAVLYASRLSGEPSRIADHYEGMVNQDHLACIDRADAVRFVHFYRSDEFPTFETFLLKMQETGRCVWWRKGDKVIVSKRNYGDDVTVAARQAASSQYLFFDRGYIEGAPCR